MKKQSKKKPEETKNPVVDTEQEIQNISSIEPREPAEFANGNYTDEIERRAYEIYENRGREEGRALEDWLQAEEELTGNRRI